MIGAVVFVVFFVIFTLISFVIQLPPGIWVNDWFNLPASDYSEIINAIVNGIVYGVIIWVVYSLVMLVYNRSKGETKIVIETKEK